MTNITTRAHGCDLSKYDLYFEPANATGQLDFVIQRISYGLMRDEAFLKLLPGVMYVPLRGGYHYLSSQIDWQKQADTFLTYVSGYDYHFYGCDFEGAYNLLSYDFAYSAYKWIDYVQSKTGKPTLLYTSLALYNQYIAPAATRFNLDWNNVKLWQAQWLFNPDPNRNPSIPTGRTSGWTIWQYTNHGQAAEYGTAIRDEFDLDVYNGTPAEMRAWLNGGTPTEPPVDIVTTPQPGLQRVSGIRNGWKFELFISDPAQVHYESVCCSPLESVSSVAKRKAATLAVNGGEWDRISQTKDYTVSNGSICHERVTAVPSLLVFQDGIVTIDHNKRENVQQALSGLRYLMRLGVIQSYLDGSELQYTEGHARSIQGVDARGFHVVMQSAGQYPNQGLTLKQAVLIMKQYGAVTAFDSGGGGDVTCVLDGESLIVPENIDPTGAHFERPLPNVFLIYAKGVNMADYYEYKCTDTTNHSIRSSYSITGTKLADLKPGTIAKGGVTEVDTYTYTADVPNGLGAFWARKGDIWRAIYDNNGVTLAGWLAEIHLGVRQNISRVLITTNPPVTKHTVDVLIDNVNVFHKDLD